MTLKGLIQEPELVAPDSEAPAALALFQNLSDRDLALLGGPDELLPAVRKVGGEDELDALQHILPAGKLTEAIPFGTLIE
ncbi:MAG: hypothetical protein MZV65_15230 [Chromatiales bacterium]|nr:hypothetical protein [Chromatiales bacterium]